MHAKAGRGAIADHEQRHGDSHPQQLIVLENHAKHLPQGGFLFLLEVVAPLLHAKQREQLESKHQHHDDGRQDEPTLRIAAGQRNQRVFGGDDSHHHRKQAHICADTRERADFLALLLVGGQRRHHGPVSDVVQAVKHVPQQVEAAHDRRAGPACEAEIEEHAQHEHAAQKCAHEDPGFELAKAAVRVIHHQTHEGVVERVEHAQHQHHGGDDRKGLVAYVQRLGDVDHQVHAHHGVEHVAANGAQSEEVMVSPVDAVVHAPISFTSWRLRRLGYPLSRRGLIQNPPADGYSGCSLCRRTDYSAARRSSAQRRSPRSAPRSRLGNTSG